MHQISIRYSKKVNEEELFGLFDDLLRHLRLNGQVNGRNWRAFALDGRMSATVLTITRQALFPEYHNIFVKEDIQKI
jgi:predicted  nucleic acid-binding Zn ribbon protein